MTLGIIGAMDEEVIRLKEIMSDVQVETRAGMSFFQGKMSGRDVVVVKCGVGKVNAAICTQILADCYHVDAVVNTGIAGALQAEINIGDIVLSVDALQHDMDASGLGFEAGVIPWAPVSVFESDEHLLQLAEEACKKANPDIHVYRGRVVSGDQFVSDKEKKEWLRITFEACCTEMEGAAIAQTAYLNEIPFLIVRAISDKADDSATVDYSTFEAQAIQHSVNLMIELVKRLDRS